MKFLLVGDRHNSENKPANRIDDFIETLNKKDAEILSIAKNNNVSAIIHAGDFWTDSDSKPKNDFVSEIIKRWIDPLNPSTSIPMIGIAGNHDLIGGNIRSLPHTTLGLVSALGYQKLVSKDSPIIFTMKNGKTIAITGTNYHINQDKPEFIDDYIVDNKLGDYHIHVVHGMLSPKNLGKIIRHTTIDAIKHTKADITFCGHDHIGFDTVNIDNKYFINPGAIVRLKNDTKELSRTVKVVLLTIDDSGISLEEIPLKSALDSSLVLSREAVEQKKEKDAAAEKMKSEIKNLQINKQTKFSEILEDIYKKEEVSQEIMDDLNKKIAEKEILNNSHLKPPAAKDVAIQQITLNNFQSHEHTVIDFSNGFNVILGESRQGKTAVMRALRWVIENKPLGSAMIRHGADKCSVTLKLANGTYITRFIGAKENGYKVIMPDGSVQEGNTHMVGMVQSLCGFNDMDITNGFSMPINFLRQGMGWYLIDDNISATERARILGSLHNTQSADAIVKDLDKENSQINNNIKNNNTQISTTQDEIKSLVEEKEHFEKIKLLLEKMLVREKIQQYLELSKKHSVITQKLQELEIAYKKIIESNLLPQIREKLTSRDTITQEIKKIEANQKILSDSKAKIKKFDNIMSQSPNVKNLSLKMSQYEELLKCYQVVQKETGRLRKIDRYLSILEPATDLNANAILSLLNKRDEIILAYKQHNKYVKTANKANEFIVASNNIAASENMIAKIKDLMISKNAIIEEQKKINNLSKEIETIDLKIKNLQKEEANYRAEKAQTLKEAKVCPICSQIISEEVIHNIGGKV